MTLFSRSLMEKIINTIVEMSGLVQKLITLLLYTALCHPLL